MAVRAHWIAFPSIIMETKIVPFRVVFATSEDDEDHEANELLAPGPDSRGWATSTYCIYPQVSILVPKLIFNKIRCYHCELPTTWTPTGVDLRKADPGYESIEEWRQRSIYECF